MIVYKYYKYVLTILGGMSSKINHIRGKFCFRIEYHKQALSRTIQTNIIFSFEKQINLFVFPRYLSKIKQHSPDSMCTIRHLFSERPILFRKLLYRNWISRVLPASIVSLCSFACWPAHLARMAKATSYRHHQ